MCDRVTNNVLLYRVKEDRNIIINGRNTIWIGLSCVWTAF